MTAQPKDEPSKPGAPARETVDLSGRGEPAAPDIPASSSHADDSGRATRTGGIGRSPGGSAAPAFARDEVLGGRYEVVRFIASGGMGAVYEVKDLKLGGHLALKTILAEAGTRTKAVDRFLREIQLARKVTHPNVCRIFDVGEHRVAAPHPDEPAPEVLFLTMELLPGETLSRRLARGRMTTAEAFDVVAQVAAGLDAAHAAGIIHRDFKSSNVMLVPYGGSRKGTRVVVTDFGLARADDPDEVHASISETGTVVGTPAYMAPEQVEGKPLTTAADVYALGVVMFEMVTGKLPFRGKSALSVAVMRLREAPTPPRQLVADLDLAWESAILRCLERDPADRFATAGDVAKALGGGVVAAGSGTAALQRRRQRRRNLTLAVGGALGCLLAAFLAVRQLIPRPGAPAVTDGTPARPPAATAPVVPRRSLAVIGLANASGRPQAAWLATAIGEVLAGDLAAGDQLRVVMGNRVATARAELGLKESLIDWPPASFSRMGRNLGTDLLLSGSYTLVGGGESPLLRIDLRLHDAPTGAVTASGTSTGTEAQLFDLVTRASGSLRRKLGLPDISPAQALDVEAALPRDREAARLYAEGLARLRTLDAKGAREVLEKAVAAEEKHPLPHAALSQAWSALGYAGRAQGEARKAAALAGALPREQKLLIEGRLHAVAGDWDKAVGTYSTLFTEHRDNLDYGLLLAETQTSAARPREALVTLDALRKLPAPASDDPRIDLFQSRSFKALDDTRQQQAAAVRAAAKGRDRGMQVVVAQARLQESIALLKLGNADEARKAAEDARALSEQAGDTGWAARSLEQMAICIERRGDFDGAQRLLARVLETHRGLGDKASVARVLLNLGRIRRKQGAVKEADRLYEDALATFRETGAKYESAVTLNEMAMRLQVAGDLPAAQKRYQEALALAGEVGRKNLVAMILTNLGEVLFTRGDLQQALEMHQEALGINRETGSRPGEAYDLYRLGEVYATRGDLRIARSRYEESLAVLKLAEDPATGLQVRLGLAALSLAEGDAGQAEKLSREAEEAARVEGGADLQALAEVALADALLSQGKVADAKTFAERAAATARKGDDRRARYGALRLGASIKGVTGSAPEQAAAIRALDTAAADAARSGFLVIASELRVAAGELEMKTGRGPAARARLQTLQREAGGKGLGLVERKAASLLAH